MKKILFSCLSLALVMMLWAFTQPRAKTVADPSLDPTWYYFLGGENDPFDPESYTLEPVSTDCSGDNVLCAILAEPASGDPAHPSQAGIDAAAMSSDDFDIESAIVEKKS